MSAKAHPAKESKSMCTGVISSCSPAPFQRGSVVCGHPGGGGKTRTIARGWLKAKTSPRIHIAAT